MYELEQDIEDALDPLARPILSVLDHHHITRRIMPEELIDAMQHTYFERKKESQQCQVTNNLSSMSFP